MSLWVSGRSNALEYRVLMGVWVIVEFGNVEGKGVAVAKLESEACKYCMRERAQQCAEGGIER